MTKSDWYSAILEWEESELTQQDFCSRRNLTYNDFKYWRTKGISEGVFTASSKWRHKSSKLPSESLSFTRLGNIDTQPSRSDSKYMEVCLPYGITLKLPV